MEKLAKMAMLDIRDAQKAKSDIEKTIKMAEILQEIEIDECIILGGTGALRCDEAKKSSLTMTDIIVPKVVGE